MTLQIQLTDPKLPKLLDRLLGENRILDQELEERRRRETNEAIVVRGIRNWFERTDRK